MKMAQDAAGGRKQGSRYDIEEFGEDWSGS